MYNTTYGCRVTVLFVALLSLTYLPFCGPAGDTRIARWPLSVYVAADKQKRETSLGKGERVELVEAGEDLSQVRLADGKTGFVESKHLFLDAAVLLDRDVRLYRRPSASSGEAASGKNLTPGVVFFVESFEENGEGRWMSVEGGQNPKFFRGWLKADIAQDNDLASVQDGLRLEEAIRKKDTDVLEELSGQSGAIGSAAAAALVDIRGVDEESDSDSEDQGDANVNTETNENVDAEATPSSSTKPSPPPPPSDL